MESQIEIFQTANDEIRIDVHFDNETVWITQKQMAELFDRNRVAITQHIGNIFKEGELIEEVVCKDFLLTTQHGAVKEKTQNIKVKFYNLDVIISVGYRVKSQRGTQFRQWATQRLKDYLVQGYTINEKRLAEKQMQVETLKTGIRILSRAIEEQITKEDSQALQLFAKGLELLDDYDHEQLDLKGKTLQEAHYPNKEEYLQVINAMQSEFASDVFAQPKDQSFESSIAQIAQSFDNQDLYPSIEEKAATLLYLIVKNHSFVDGNKRIGAACFLYFLQKNNRLFIDENVKIMSNEALATLTLFVATSKPEEMDTVKKLIISILNRK